MKTKRYISRRHLPQAVLVLLMLLLLMGWLAGCDAFVEAGPPEGQLSTPLVFEDPATATVALEEAYAKMRDRGMLSGGISGLSYALGLYADELDYYDAAGEDGFQYHANSLQPSSSGIAALWKDSYAQVYGANAVLYGVEHSQSLGAADRRQLRGEALFLRAVLHCGLSGLFGDVPYIATTDYRANAAAGKIPAGQVLERAREDLEAAVGLLEEEYPHAERTRANRYAAHAMLARVCLYLEDWAGAAEHAAAVIGQQERYALEGSLQEAFRASSRATILQFSPPQAGGSTQEALAFTFTDNPPPGVALSPALLAAFEPGDQRRAFWVTEVPGGSQPYFHASKYTLAPQGGGPAEYSIVLRLPEMLLVRSEARARQGLLAAALEDLNAVRHFAGLGDSPAATQPEILEAVLRERRVELFTEFGHRFADLKRTGRLDAVLGAVKPGWDHGDRMFPLPQQEILLQPGLLPQNPGY